MLLASGFCSRAGPSRTLRGNEVRRRCGIVASRFRSWCRTHWDVSLRWSAMRSDEPPPGWLSVIWRFIKVRGPRHACVSPGFFYFMESLISRGSLASARCPVLMNATADLSAQCASSSSAAAAPAASRMHHMINRKGPVTLPKCVRGGDVCHSITWGEAQRRRERLVWATGSLWLRCREGDGVRHNVAAWKMRCSFNNLGTSAGTVFHVEGNTDVCIGKQGLVELSLGSLTIKNRFKRIKTLVQYILEKIVVGLD